MDAIISQMDFIDALNLLAEEQADHLDVAEIALLFAADEYPDLDQTLYLRMIDRLATEVEPRLVGDLADRVTGLASFLFEEKGFRGNELDYYDPRNSYLNDVLERRMGIPISLTVLAMAVGERAGLDVVGVGLPGHFIAKAVDGDEEILFDPYHGGQLLTADACTSLVEAVTGESFVLTPEVLQPLSLRLIVMRMLNNLKGTYLKREDFPRAVRIMERLRILAPEDPIQRRDLGVALVRAGRAGTAIDHLSAYLARFPDAADAKLVKEVLQKANNEVARWN